MRMVTPTTQQNMDTPPAKIQPSIVEKSCTQGEDTSEKDGSTTTIDPVGNISAIDEHHHIRQDGGSTALLQVLACWLLFMNTWFVGIPKFLTPFNVVH